MADATEGPAESPAAEPDLPCVVCVEADLDNLGLIQRVLESTGRYRVTGATDGVSGLELMRRQRPSLVLLDLDLPLADGLEILRRVRADATIASIPVVAVSASVMKGERRRCLDAGFTAFVEKPFDVHQLRGLVARLLPHSPTGADGPDPGTVADHEA